MYIMEEAHNNTIKKFKCAQCNIENNMLKCVSSSSLHRCGYLCEYCWTKFHKRMAEIYFCRLQNKCNY
jgi:hypothetical protein